MALSEAAKLLHAELAAAKASAGADRVESILSILYAPIFQTRGEFATAETANPALATAISKIRERIPQNVGDVNSLISELNLGDLETVVLFACSLSKMRSPTGWVHHRLANCLGRLSESGHRAARAPCIIHCLLCLENTVLERDNEAYPRAILAREMNDISPRDAVLQAIQALRFGMRGPWTLDPLAAAARKLGVAVETGVDPMPHLVPPLLEAFSVSPTHSFAISRVRESRGVETSIVVERDEVTFPAPRGDASYYLFRPEFLRRVRPAIRVHKIPEGTLSFDLKKPSRVQFYVFNKHMECVSELSHGVDPFVVDGRLSLQGDGAVIGDQFSGVFNICHMVLDRLTRMYLYRKLNPGPIKFVADDDSPYFAGLCAAAGLSDAILCQRTKRFSIQFDNLLFSSNITVDFRHPAHFGAPWALEYVRSQLSKSERAAPDRKIYISRRDSNARKILNNDEIECLFRDLGYEIVILSAMTPAAQVEVFQSASHVVGAHGAGLTNLVFCHKTARVLEIFPPLGATQAYWLVASSLGLRYHAFVADDPDLPRPDYRAWEQKPGYNNRHIIVSKQKIIQAVREFEE